MELHHSCDLTNAPQSRTLPIDNRTLLAPPINRTSMAPRQWSGRARNGRSEPGATSVRWQRSGTWRRALLYALVLVQTWIATDFMTSVLPYQGRQLLEIGMLALFAVLFAWVSLGFWTAMAGFVLALRGRDRFAIGRTIDPNAPLDPTARTAIVMPICNENVQRVFAGLLSTVQSLERTGATQYFDFFVLSDSTDADVRVAELAAWEALCTATKDFGRIFYRSRRHNIKRKSGNIADFCRRWGANYRYMIVLDADSVMTGSCMMALVRMMEANPSAGIIQTAPIAVGRDTLHARVQQFATSVYGPIYAAGLHFWHLGEALYFGHNAIIRLAPFMRYCALGRLPGRGALSGEVMSHDFVEAALMRRAGWGVWIAYDLPGSYEELPPNLLDELNRDRRWCQGNLINSRFTTMRGLAAAHRAVFMTGVMAYASAPLWFALLVLSTVLLAVHTLGEARYFVQPYQLFPVWPEWRPERAIALLSTTAVLLFVPKILAVLATIVHRPRRFGGVLRLIASALGEIVISMLLAPIRMLFHTRFVITTLAGNRFKWRSPSREDTQTGWSEAWQRHRQQMLIGIVWAYIVYRLEPSFLWWLLPVAGALVLAVPLSAILSRTSIGAAARSLGLFLIPEETAPPREIVALRASLRGITGADFFAAVVDRETNALVCRATRDRPSAPRALKARHFPLVAKAFRRGPDALTPREKAILLDHPLALAHLSDLVLRQPASVWQRPSAVLPD